MGAMRWRLLGSAVLSLIVFNAAPAAVRAQSTPDVEPQIAAYIEASTGLAQSYAMRPRPDPYADLQARSESLSAARRAEAQALFVSAFGVWQAGDFAAAEIGFQRGLEIDPANGAANFYLGDCLRRRGDAAGAADYMSRAAAFGPTSSEGLRAQAALRELPAPPDPSTADPPVIFAPPGEPITFRDCAGCLEMVVVPAGAFTMGSSSGGSDERPQRRVTFARPFAVSKFEITRAQFAAFVNATHFRSPLPDDCILRSHTGFPRSDDHPVVCITRDGAYRYIHWLSSQTQRRYRLLSEAEWEYVARAGTVTRDWWGDEPFCTYENLPDAARFAAMSNSAESSPRCNDGASYTAAVGSYRPNPFGLYDMMGNVSEMVEDCYSASYSGLPADGSANRDVCVHRNLFVVRGGSWASTRGAMTRDSLGSIYDRDTMGFRVARDL